MKLNGTLIFNTVLTLLVSLVIAQIVLQMSKYGEHHTTVARSVREYDEIPAPAVSFCPGYKRSQVLDKHLWIVSPGLSMHREPLELDNNLSQLPDDLDELWSNITFSPEEVILDLNLWIDNETTYEYPDADSECVDLKEYDTISGRCYSVVNRCPMTTNHHYTANLNLTSLTKHMLPIYIHDPGSYLGLNQNFWPIKTTTYIEIHDEVTTDLAMIRYEAKRKDSMSKEDFYKCVSDAQKEWVESLKDFCYFPAFKSVLAVNASIPKEFPPCKTTKEYYDSVDAVFDFLNDISTGINCSNKMDNEVEYRGNH